MALFDLVIGKPLATSEECAEHIGPIAGIPVFGLDALSSAAYGPEAVLTLLIPLGLAGVKHIVPISFAIIGLLAIVFISYLQTIDAYPHGGGSYTVASENLGANSASMLSLWLLAKVFASGCTAMTGVEAVSNGVNVRSTTSGLNC
jgi:amino acid transporter